MNSSIGDRRSTAGDGSAVDSVGKCLTGMDASIGSSVTHPCSL